MLSNRLRKCWKSPLSRSSPTFLGLHTFEVIKGFIHWYLALKEIERYKELQQAHIILYNCSVTSVSMHQIRQILKGLRVCGMQRSIEELAHFVKNRMSVIFHNDDSTLEVTALQ